jgi:hypothetical protein
MADSTIDRLIHAATCCIAVAASAAALAQQAPDAATAQQRYDRTLAYCNSGSLPRPERDSCIRDAGRALERAQGGLPPDANDDVTLPGGRATVVMPPGAPLPRSDSNTITSPDGDSTIVLPSDGSRPISQ